MGKYTVSKKYNRIVHFYCENSFKFSRLRVLSWHRSSHIIFQLLDRDPKPDYYKQFQMGGILDSGIQMGGNAFLTALSAPLFAHTASGNAELFSYETKKGG